MFSCECCKIIKSTNFKEHLRTVASGYTGNDSTVWKVCKYGVFSGPYFPVFGLKKKDQKKLRIWTLFTQCSDSRMIQRLSLQLPFGNTTESFRKLTFVPKMQKNIQNTGVIKKFAKFTGRDLFRNLRMLAHSKKPKSYFYYKFRKE